MNQAEVNRVAHSSVAALIRVNAESGEGDLWIDAEEWDEADQARFLKAVDRIADYHERLGDDR